MKKTKVTLLTFVNAIAMVATTLLWQHKASPAGEFCLFGPTDPWPPGSCDVGVDYLNVLILTLLFLAVATTFIFALRGKKSILYVNLLLIGLALVLFVNGFLPYFIYPGFSLF
ncbi:MAG: hypothetical protein A3C93_05890 [Candidatus Lloydbacteria bacterium RIFCSPHIGHO2_02_FULL_54_17]|uniref:Uncharacterized protein n=1 Tax=Candidatus Lloydbacteria bacterium RIFCSPHIGHO2_02_FULL_54_17 TaxID=1798664 RepID=A0A1G2DEH0_9BACT|nr:MAG: hypothetical protein A2762_02370 [Candidatus Lloydbacteria bacterium RIFCSPHIGHO2_01_FULL_54_11]OGZ11943.1 MAG: hypothetical protein A3C93_05890 [Candidatus Lloydbacteria bacterium RIFCSPHIGHO2_02_FULL_54_17]OGZ14197.1 MAG: hypothetical protein A2948_02580 [Candidatus Lloydbacteria bacterium RIFCSPLOWO2_01_FULL_54_18]OGZ15087.1 MAG: hypothetical protein A3H76_06710 [Candidatus Lloydbacteria bacterium RIFCSPLOWO2_02_FULL_54_12]